MDIFEHVMKHKALSLSEKERRRILKICSKFKCLKRKVSRLTSVMTMVSSPSTGRCRIRRVVLLFLISTTFLWHCYFQMISLPSLSDATWLLHYSESSSRSLTYWTVMVTVNDGYYDFLLNWLYHFERLNLNIGVIVIAEDNLVKQKLQARELKTNIRIEQSGLDLEPKAYGFGHSNFKVLMATRATHIWRHLQAGTNLIFSDIDTVWRLNPLPYFETEDDFDMMIQVDAKERPREPRVKPWYCAGFMAIKSNERTIQMMTDWEAALKEKPQLNQPTFNEILHSKSSSVKHIGLPSENFPNGVVYFEHFNDPQRQKVVIVHNNFIVGHDEKKQRFVSHGLWNVSDY